MKPQRTFAPDEDSTYFVTFSTEGRRRLFLKDAWASLFIDVLQHYRTAYELHEFVVMQDHVHLILTPTQSLEKAIQLIKGGFSYRAKRELQTKLGIWQRGFTDHRIRDTSDYAQHRYYIHQNPVRKGLCEHLNEFRWSSASGIYSLDLPPQRLKPLVKSANRHG